MAEFPGTTAPSDSFMISGIIETAIGVDQQPRTGCEDGRGAEHAGQGAGDCRGPDVIGDMALELGCG